MVRIQNNLMSLPIMILNETFAKSIGYIYTFPLKMFVYLNQSCVIYCAAVMNISGMELVGPRKRIWTGNVIQTVLTFGNLYLALVVFLIRDWPYFQLACALPLVLCLPYYW